ncbi:MAG: lipid II flippase MurJ [Actinomycetaceae bacterium]|nr:lipid II flippase MurJ [Actinomycetaceae bacterium]
MRRIGASVAGAAGTIAALTLLSRLIGFVRTWAQNGALGDTVSGEAYSTANTVPNVLFEVAAGGALAGAVIPLISGFLAQGMRAELGRTASALVTWILAVGLPIAGLVAVLSGPITRALLGAHTGADELALASTLLRIFALQIPLYGLSVVFTGILQAHKRFLLPAIAPMLSSVTVIGSFAIFGHLARGAQETPGQLSVAAVAWLGWGTTLGVVAFTLPQLVPVLRVVSLRPTFAFPPGVARRALGLIGAGLGGLFAQQVQIVAIMVVANARGGTGAYPVYTFANAVYMVPYAVLAVPVATAVFPRLSEAAALDGKPGLSQLTARSTRLVLDIGIVCVGLLAVLAEPSRIVFDVLRPAVGMETAMVAMAPGLAGYALIYHGSRVLYAVEASRSVVIVNSLAWLSVCASLGIFAALGVGGRRDTLVAIGVSISLGMTIGAIGQLTAIRRAIGRRATAGMARSASITAVVTCVCAGLGWLAVRMVLGVLGQGLVGGLAAIIVAGLIIAGGGLAAIFATDRQALRMTDARQGGNDDDGTA